MCSISGIILKDEDEPSSLRKEISKHLLMMMRILKHRGPDASGMLVDDKVLYFKDFREVKENITADFSFGHNRLAIVGSATQPIPNEDESLWVICNGEIYNYIELREDLSNHNFKTDTDSEVIVHAYEEDMLNELDGEYAYAIYDKNNNSLILRRDTFGVKPLFYLDRKDYFAFASERKALWYLLKKIEGIDGNPKHLNEYINRLSPNSELTYYLKDNKYTITNNLEKLRFDYLKYKSYETCKKELDNALWNAVWKRTRGIGRVGIIYSGGVDSTLIAKMASEYCEVILYTVGTEESEDIKYAERAAKDMGLKLRKKIIMEEEYERYIFEVAKAIDELDLMKIGVGIPIYVASEMAREDNIKVVLSGQGADELFGGYSRYERILREKGEDELKKSLLEDVMNIYKVNLERDDHCTMANSVELRVPFLDKDVVRVALSIPVTYKMDEMRKRILRDIASKYIPDYIAYRPKKAAQYGSGSEKMIFKVAREYGYPKKEINKFFEEVVLEEVNKSVSPNIIL
ncbi:asparagine synthase (glutamine-hydrolyzing), partial [Methanotorris formicicus]